MNVRHSTPAAGPTMYLHPLLVALLLLTVGCNGDDSNSSNDVSAYEKEGTVAFVQSNGDTLRTIDVDIADTDAERTRGLMHQRSLGYDQGMLFIFDTVDKGSMWMRNTPMPLDIVFVAPDSQVINIVRRTTPFSETKIEPEAPREYVVEVRAGFADQFGLTDSTRIRWTRTVQTE